MTGSATDSEDLSPSSPDRRRSFSSVIHFERPASIRLNPLDDTERLRPSSSRSSRSMRTNRPSDQRSVRSRAESEGRVDFRLVFFALMLLATVTSLDNVRSFRPPLLLRRRRLAPCPADDRVPIRLVRDELVQGALCAGHHPDGAGDRDCRLSPARVKGAPSLDRTLRTPS